MPKRSTQRAPARPPLFPRLAEATLRGYLAPRLAADARLDLRPVIAAIGTPARGARLDAAAVRAALDRALAPRDGKAVLAADADVADVQEVISQLDDMASEVADLVVGGGQEDPGEADPPGAPAVEPGAATGDPDPDRDGEIENAEPVAQVLKFLADKLSPEDLQSIRKMLERKQAKKDDGSVTKPAMDAAIAAALAAQGARFRALEQARLDVLPIVGPVRAAMDSAADVYRAAFRHLGVDVADVDPATFPTILRVHRQAAGSGASHARPAAATDAAPAAPLFADAMARLK